MMCLSVCCLWERHPMRHGKDLSSCADSSVFLRVCKSLSVLISYYYFFFYFFFSLNDHFLKSLINVASGEMLFQWAVQSRNETQDALTCSLKEWIPTDCMACLLPGLTLPSLGISIRHDISLHSCSKWMRHSTKQEWQSFMLVWHWGGCSFVDNSRSEEEALTRVPPEGLLVGFSSSSASTPLHIQLGTNPSRAKTCIRGEKHF